MDDIPTTAQLIGELEVSHSEITIDTAVTYTALEIVDRLGDAWKEANSVFDIDNQVRKCKGSPRGPDPKVELDCCGRRLTTAI